MENKPLPAPVIVLLIGGKSSRMGTDKAFLTFDGRTILERLARLVRAMGATLIISGRESQRSTVERLLGDVRFVADRAEFQGPMGAIHGLLLELRSKFTVLPIDAIGIDEAFINWMTTSLAPINTGLSVLRTDGGVEPLFGSYCPDVLPSLEEFVKTGDRSLRAWILRTAREVAFVDVPMEFLYGLANINTPAELETVQRENR